MRADLTLRHQDYLPNLLGSLDRDGNRRQQQVWGKKVPVILFQVISVESGLCFTELIVAWVAYVGRIYQNRGETLLV